MSTAHDIRTMPARLFQLQYRLSEVAKRHEVHSVAIAALLARRDGNDRNARAYMDDAEHHAHYLRQMRDEVVALRALVIADQRPGLQVVE